PMLVMQGEMDYAVGPNQAKMIYNALTDLDQKNKRLKMIPNAAHNLNMEAENEYYATLLSFLKKYNH
ncbi:MAG: alpha/beta hydrolase family protein, partial [Sphingobacterium sp.]